MSSRGRYERDIDSLDAEAGRVFDGYLADLEAGREADPRGLIDAHPALADRLRACLDVQRWSEQIAAVGLDERIGLRLGDFRVVREIGRGGMGIVYEAEQVSLGRPVALKILPPAAAIDPRTRRRFELEAYAVASLHHTNIVPIHAVGCEGGMPYYAMQLIDGRDLADLIRSFRREAPPAGEGGPPKGRTDGTTPTPSSRGRRHASMVARIGLQAAEAIEHAHARGVLHRDVKPANLLLDTEGRLWVTDFGLARIAIDHDLTATGDLLGTVRYMSPEQARAARVFVDGRTDVYSLGVTLYELLTLRPAIEGDDRQELLRKIADVEPISPRRHDPSIPRDLETILLKATAKDPADRYATARGMAADLRRFLDDRAIEARRPTLVERAARWARRHTAMAVSATATLALATASLTAGTMILWAEQSRTVAALRAAEAGRREARRAVDTMYTRVAEEWLKGRPRLEGVQREFLEEAERFYDVFAREAGADPSIRREAARAAQRAGDIQRELGRKPQARSSYRRAMDLLEGLLAGSPASPELRQDLSMCSMTLGFVLERERPHEAERAHRRAVALMEGLEAEFPSVPRYADDLAQRCTNLGNALVFLGQYGEAERAYRRGCDLARALTSRYPDRPRYLYSSAVTLNNVGETMARRGHDREAEASFRLAVEGFGLLPADYNPRFKLNLANSHQGLCNILLPRGDEEGSRLALQEALRLIGGLARDFPTVPDYREATGRLYVLLGRHHAAYGRIREAEQVLTDALAIQAQASDGLPVSPGDISWRQHSTEIALGDALTMAGRVDEAREHYRRGLESMRTYVATLPDALEEAGLLSRLLANSPDPRLRDPEEALRLAIRAAEAAPSDAVLLTSLGLAYYRVGAWEGSIRALEKARLDDPKDPTGGLVLAMASWQAGERSRARDLFEENSRAAMADRPRDFELSRLHAEASSLIDAR